MKFTVVPRSKALLCQLRLPQGALLTRTVREQNGSMLSMTALIGGIVVFACMLGFCFYLLLAENKKSQSRAEQSAIDLAKILNEDDRVGQVNNVVVRSRELVFLSRQNESKAAAKNFANWEPLARFLVDEARTGSLMVESERKNQIETSKKSIRFFADHFNLHTVDKPVFSLPFFHTWDAEINDVTLGSISTAQSNVLNTDIYPDLRDFDEHEKYFQKGSNLYMGNINARLPAPDNDLDFKIASLPAPVEKTIAPARLVNGNVFKPSGTMFKDLKFIDAKMDQIPTALDVVELVWITAVSNDERQMRVEACASTNGAQPPP